MTRGDTVRFKWGNRSGRWVVLRTKHPFWPDAVRLRCTVAPRGKRHQWKVGAEGWVRAKVEAVGDSEVRS